ncbi:MAG TPA: DUF4349 domain-containing protein [Thermoleophilia bacterium]|nr:DUF4349 domain-containing protein [Thermoleophilia bacterium]
MRRRVNLKIIIPSAIVGLLVLFAAVGALSTGFDGTSPTLDRSSTGASPSKTVTSDATAQDAGASEASGSGARDGVAAAVPPGEPIPDHYLVRNGDLSLLIERGALLAAVDRIGTMTAEMDGYIMSSSIGTSSGGYPPDQPQPLAEERMPQTPASTLSSTLAPDQAWMTLRVPEGRFETAMKRFATLGEVQRITSSSDDVTTQYVDLQAQLRHYRAVEQRLLRFLAATETIREMLAVQDRIDTVQLTIEQLQAQLKSLHETTSYGTIAVSLLEKGTPQSGQIDSSDTFGGVFWNSLTLLGRGAHLTALAITAALPFLVVLGGLGLAVWYAARRLRGRRRPTQPTLPT